MTAEFVTMKYGYKATLENGTTIELRSRIENNTPKFYAVSRSKSGGRITVDFCKITTMDELLKTAKRMIAEI